MIIWWHFQVATYTFNHRNEKNNKLQVLCPLALHVHVPSVGCFRGKKETKKIALMSMVLFNMVDSFVSEALSEI